MRASSHHKFVLRADSQAARPSPGHAKEAATASLDLGFNRFGAEEIIALTVDGNAASWGLMRRLGMSAGGDPIFRILGRTSRGMRPGRMCQRARPIAMSSRTRTRAGSSASGTSTWRWRTRGSPSFGKHGRLPRTRAR